MEVTMTAVETTGTIDEHHQLQLDSLLPIPGPMHVRIIVLYPRSDEWDETEWLSKKSVFARLRLPRGSANRSQ